MHPYAALLRQRAARRDIRVTHLRLPIRDVDVPAPWQMHAILETIRLALDDGQIAYVHCWRGVGRTGTVIGCHLVEEGIPPDEVVAHIAALRRRTQRGRRVSPETDAQRTSVTSWSGPADRERYVRSGRELPDDVDDLRACLFLELRNGRLGDGDDVTFSEPDAQGSIYVISNPQFETSPTQRFRRAIV